MSLQNKEIFYSIDSGLLARFKKYHQENPHVYAQFKVYAAQMRQTGKKKYSAWTIINKIRWDEDLKTSDDVFRINNDFIALYARLLIFHDSSYEGFFELRTMKPFDRRESSEERYRKEARQ